MYVAVFASTWPGSGWTALAAVKSTVSDEFFARDATVNETVFPAEVLTTVPTVPAGVG